MISVLLDIVAVVVGVGNGKVFVCAGSFFLSVLAVKFSFTTDIGAPWRLVNSVPLLLALSLLHSFSEE